MLGPGAGKLWQGTHKGIQNFANIIMDGHWQQGLTCKDKMDK